MTLAVVTVVLCAVAVAATPSLPPLPMLDNMTDTPVVLVDALGLAVTWTHSWDQHTPPSPSSIATVAVGSPSWAVVPVGVVLYAGGTATVIGTLVYIIGGSVQSVRDGVDNVYVLDASRAVHPGCLKPLDPVPVGVSAHAAVAFENKIYVAGGYVRYVTVKVTTPAGQPLP